MSLTTQIMDLRPAGLDTEDLWRQRQQYEALCRGEPLEEGKSIRRPGRDDFATLYRLLRDGGGWHSSQEMLWQGAAAGVAGGENGAVFDLTMHVRRTQGTGALSGTGTIRGTWLYAR